MTTTTLDATDLEIEFATSLPGLTPLTSFRLTRIEGAEDLYALRAVSSDARLFLLDPAGGKYGYEPRIGRGLRAEVGAETAEDVQLFVVVNPCEDGVYVNLRAPILIHRGTGAAAQVILDDSAYPIRTPLS